MLSCTGTGLILLIYLFQIITLDRGIIEMGADVYYNISDVVKTVTTVQDLNSSIRALLRNVLMNHVVKYEMDQVEAQKYNIVADVMVSMQAFLHYVNDQQSSR